MNYAKIRKLDVTNGPGIRTTLFVSGCTHNCEGCFNKEQQDFNYGNKFTKETEDEFIQLTKNKQIKGVNILGGEPMQQIMDDTLLNLLKRIKLETDKPIWLWSGYTFEEIVNNPKRLEILREVDVLIDGKFQADKRDIMLKYRGSSNQRVIDVKKSLELSNIDYIVFDEIEENPSLETIEQGALLGKENDVNFVIGIGGGSPLDASKAIAVMIKNPDLTKDTVLTNKALEAIDVIAVPTTAGTGSETTQYSIVTVHKEKTKKNLGQSVFPKLALLDASYMNNMNSETTINTAIDALSHLVEGYLNVNANFFTDALVEKALKVWGECIDSLLNKSFNFEVREKFMIASTIAGMVIAQTGTSLPHGMGYSLTYFKGLPHGIANGCLYREYLKVFKDKEKVNNIWKYLGLSSFEELDNILEKLTKVDIEISDEEIKEYTEGMWNNKAKLKNHTEEITYEEIYNIYKNSLS